MKAERIGATPRQELEWVLRTVYPTMPRTEGDKLNLLTHDLMLFAMGYAGPVPHRSDQYLEDTLQTLELMIDRAIDHELIQLPRPYGERLIWDDAKRRYKKDTQQQSEVFETRVTKRLGELLLDYGHLLKICTAPEKMKAGRKPKDGGEEKPRGVCGKRFLAVKETQKFHSKQCLARALAETKATKTPKPKVRKKKPKK